MTLRIRIETAIGPTPPGTGLIQPVISLTASVSTSPTIGTAPSAPVI